jgi:hypothetical protein
MAARTSKNANGETRFGNRKGPGSLYIRSGKASQGAWIALDAVNSAGAVTTVYLWASTDGKLRTSTTVPADTEAGTVVGSQT